jgi:hypothetical protein
MRHATVTRGLLAATGVLAFALHSCRQDRPRSFAADHRARAVALPGAGSPRRAEGHRSAGGAARAARVPAAMAAAMSAQEPTLAAPAPAPATPVKPAVAQKFIASQIESAWARYLSYAVPVSTSPPRRVLVHPGLVPVFSMNGEGSGPKGELVQWASLIAAIARLGHNLTVAITPADYGAALMSFDPHWIFTDYAGIRGYLHGGTKTVPGFDFPGYYKQHRCRYYVLDIYGTSAEFNAMTPSKSSGFFNGLQLPSLKQFLSWIPDTIPDPENTFLGFAQVIDREVQRQAPALKAAAPRTALVWGKEQSYWTAPGVADYLARFTDKGYALHATMGGVGIPKSIAVTNHGSMSPHDFVRLLASAELFIGLGDPIIGPSPIDALAYGCVYINPKFIPPKDLAKYGKPSHHAYTSQVPLLEAIGEPHVYTVSINDFVAVDAAIGRIKQRNLAGLGVAAHEVEAYAPEAFLARVEALVIAASC